MSHQLYLQHYAQHSISKVLLICTGRAFLEYAGLPSPKTVCVPRFHKSQALQVGAAHSQTSQSGSRRNHRSGAALVACHRGIPSPLRFVRTPSDFVWLSRIRLAYRDVWIFRRIRRFFDRNRRRFRGCAKSGRSRHSKCHANQMPKSSQRKLPVPPSSMSSSVQPPPVL